MRIAIIIIVAIVGIQVRQQVADQLHATFSASGQPDLQPVLSLLADTHWYKRVSTNGRAGRLCWC
jgi:hypothetical protein